MTLKFAPKFHAAIISGQKTQTRRPINGKPPKWVPGEVYELPDVGVRVLCLAVRSERLHAYESCDMFYEGYDYRDAALSGFKADWDSFYGKGAFDRNPLVWVYSFKVVES